MTYYRNKPRSFFSLFWRFGGWVALIMSLIALFIWAAATQLEKEIRDLALFGVSVKADILETHKIIEEGDWVKITYEVTVRYTHNNEPLSSARRSEQRIL